MYVVDVIPFSRSAPAGSLSYRSREALPEGTIVEVLLRRKLVQGLVVGCQSVSDAKATLKTATFTLSRAVPQIAGSLPEVLRAAAHRTAEYHAATLGSTLASLFGEHIRSDLSLASIVHLSVGSGFHTETAEYPFQDRAQTYTSVIEENTDRGHATLLVVPTLAETEFWKEQLSLHAPLVLSSALNEKRREAALAACAGHTGVVISTPTFSWTPIASLGAIIIERAGAGSYRLPKRPYLDMRIALKELAMARQIPLWYGDFPLPLEYRPVSDAPLAVSAAPISVIDARREKSEEKEQQAVDEPWTALPKEMQEMIGHAVGRGGRVLVLAVRKGYAPSVVCRDCGTTRTDEFGNVLTFTKDTPLGPVFRTADGKVVEQANVTCATCGSWNLLPLGIGVERVEEELRAAFPDSTVIHFEGDTVRTGASAKKALKEAKAPGTIIVGTEAALPWLQATHMYPFDLAAIASADSLLALPFWRSRERFLRVAFLMRAMSGTTCLGTRMPDDTAVQATKDSTATTFFTEEARLRKALGYPPFGTLLTLQAEGTRTQLDVLDTSIRAALGPHAFTVLPDRFLTRTQLRRSYVVRLAPGVWPDAELARTLRHLPPTIRILIDTESF